MTTIERLLSEQQGGPLGGEQFTHMTSTEKTDTLTYLPSGVLFWHVLDFFNAHLDSIDYAGDHVAWTDPNGVVYRGYFTND